MRLLVLGDSIARGVFTDKRKGENAPLSIACPTFAEHLKKMLNAEEMINYAVSGISYCSCSPINAEQALSKTYIQAKGGDIVIIAGGTNDYGTSVELGKKEDCEDKSFFGAVDIVFRGIKENNPGAEIFIVIPIPRDDEGKNEKGYVLEDYRSALEYKAKLYGFNIIDGRKIPIHPDREEDLILYMDDGLHPNNAGHKLYADMVYAEIVNSGGKNL